MNRKIMQLISLFVLAVCSLTIQSQEVETVEIDRDDPQLVFAYQGEAILTQDDVDGAFSRVPEEYRLMFIRDGAKVDQMVKGLLQVELVALDADAHEFAQRPEIQARMALAARKELAEAWRVELIEKAPEPDYALMAQEEYLVDPISYSKSATVNVTHILIGTEARLPSEAEAIAMNLMAKLEEDPAQFTELVMEYSDDPFKVDNQGSYTNMKPTELVKPFADAAFAMTEPGEITGPVETEFGFHIIRLDSIKRGELMPFEEVEDEIIETQKAKYLSEYQDRYIKNVLQHPVVFPNGSVEIMAKRHFGENFEMAPRFREEGVELGAGTADQ